MIGIIEGFSDRLIYNHITQFSYRHMHIYTVDQDEVELGKLKSQSLSLFGVLPGLSVIETAAYSSTPWPLSYLIFPPNLNGSTASPYHGILHPSLYVKSNPQDR
jgi:hypothetical protein